MLYKYLTYLVNISKNGLEREKDKKTNDMLDSTIDTSYFSSPPTSPNTKFEALESELLSLSKSCKGISKIIQHLKKNTHFKLKN
jgi:hypothetical protein